MHSIPLFDCLTHPMPDGGWLQSNYDKKNTVDRLLQQMKEQNICWAFSVGMGNKIGGYIEDSYANFIHESADNLFPVAFIDFQALEQHSSVFDYLSGLQELGYVGIKIHPRIAQVTYDHPLLAEIVTTANELGLIVMFCTYFWDNTTRGCSNNMDTLIDLLSLVSEQKLILLHGGAVRVLEMMEVARAYTHVLLDLSSTLCKYEGSSLDLDIHFLFQRFDRRICVGSDSPEFTPFDLRRRFDFFSKGVEVQKLENIAYRNLLEFTGLSNDTTAKE